jgi:hypothetical protein
MRESLQQFYDKVSGRQVFVIAGGPTVAQQNLELLKGKKIVCINNAYKLIEDPVALYWADEHWASQHVDNLQKHKCKHRFHSRFHLSQQIIDKDIKGVGNCTLLKRTAEYGVDPNVNHVCGNNGGAQVLNLLLNMKVREIVLLGYDMKLISSKSHWHGGHGLPIRPCVYFNFIESVKSIAPFLEKAKINVINTSPNTDLDCFTKHKLEDVV